MERQLRAKQVRMIKQVRVVTLCLLLWAGAWGSAQISPEAQQALAKGAQAAAQALATYEEQLLDKPLWREAINYGEQAKQLAPNSKEPYRFLGQVYSTVKWYSRAWDAWTRFIELGGSRNAQTDRYIAEASRWLGNSSFEQKNYQDAVKYYNALQEIDPSSEEANQHLALSYIALNQPQEAQPYLERLAQAHPDNPEYANLYESATRTLTYGVEAVTAFDKGMALFNGGRKDEALFEFRRATQANENFKDAFVYAGRVSLELGLSDEAVAYWERALQLDPASSEAQEALALAQGQSRYGVGAFRAFQEGVLLYQQGRNNEARQSFLNAVSQNSRYEEAWAYLGQIASEQQDYQGAITYYTSALSLSPANNQYTAAITQAQGVLDAQAAETARLAEEQARQEEEARQAALLAQQQEEERQAEIARQEEAARQAQTETERLEAERLAEQARQEAARLEAERLEAQRLEAERLEAQRLEAERLEAERLEAERLEAERLEAERLAQEQAAAEQAAQEAAATTPTETTEASVAGGSEPQVVAPSGGGPVVLLDINYTHKKPDEGGSGAFSFFKSPPNLSGDISNFASGTVYQRVEVLSKPSDRPVNYQICLVNGDDISVGPACSNLGALTFSSPGTYEAEQSVTAFSNYGSLSWERGLTEVMLVLKDENGNSLDDRYSYATSEALDLDQYYPMEVRYTAILVPEGSSFPGWP
jgi:tetratricopeptide (TPR) repeat protein